MHHHLITTARAIVRHSFLHRLVSLTLPSLVLLLAPVVQAQVIINEIFYHPTSEDVREEYIELFNTGTSGVSLNGWRFSNGIDFTFTNASIPAGGFLVVVADLATFTNAHPGMTNVAGNFRVQSRMRKNFLDSERSTLSGEVAVTST